MKIKRIFDVLPSNSGENGQPEAAEAGGFGADMLNCLGGGRGGNKCSTDGSALRGGVGAFGGGHISAITDPRMGKRQDTKRRRDAMSYIKWIRSFD